MLQPQYLSNVQLDKEEMDHYMKEAMSVKADPKAIPDMDKLYKKVQKLGDECRYVLKELETEERKFEKEIKRLEKYKLENESELERMEKEKDEVTEQLKELNILENEDARDNESKNQDEVNAIKELKNELEELLDQIEKDKTKVKQNLKEIKQETKNMKDPKEQLKKRRDEIEGAITRKYITDESIPIKLIGLMLEKERDKHLEDFKKMCDVLKPVKKGQINIDTAKKCFDEGLAGEYVYPKFGGKEQFEKVMANESATKINKK
jgi:DNA repair exonuclease SbcCD ATPase subunit